MNLAYVKFYNPAKNFAVDEVIVKFKGRVIFRQYIPKKRNVLASKFTDCVTNQVTPMVRACIWVTIHASPLTK
jgi:hypothetical protein